VIVDKQTNKHTKQKPATSRRLIYTVIENVRHQMQNSLITTICDSLAEISNYQSLPLLATDDAGSADVSGDTE